MEDLVTVISFGKIIEKKIEPIRESKESGLVIRGGFCFFQLW